MPSILSNSARSIIATLLTTATLLALLTLNANTLQAAEPELPIRSGLLLWLDAQQPASSAKDGDSLATWQDASGNGHDFKQADTSSQPKLVKVGDRFVVRFDGEADHLRCTDKPTSLKALTIFIVAAPHDNPGEFRGFFAANAPEKRDYQSGICVDLGPGATFQFDNLNVEGSGFSGARDLLASSDPFGTLHTIEIAVVPDRSEVTLTFDGKASGARPLSSAELSLAELTVGARFYNNSGGPQKVQGPIKADMAEILLYDHPLNEADATAVRNYLKLKHAKLADELPQSLKLTSGQTLVKAENPPDIQMLVPGFRVRELPIELTNINSVRFRDDGKLVTLGYNGDLHLLSDTDGDGLEDQAKVFWKNSGQLRGPIGLQLTPKDYAKGRGVFVPSKGKLSLIVDTNNDDEADEEIVVATGWKEIPQNVDAVGITMDKEGWLYFGLGTANYANAYQVDEAGKAAFELSSDRGTVQRVSPDFSKRETVCTGIRFPIAFAFNREGDLFCSEQEGATWLANGNPFDELLHIQSDRHYGFPPRHPKHNPGVIDEPSTFDYGPQHQSTCGMVFNESVNSGPVFGPQSWTGDAIMCGESRGKIWRTTLVKAESGYVATSQLIAALQLLTVDACVAPNGDLVVACHTGPPDWGTGPTGIGKLYRIEMNQPDVARPATIWAASPQEIRIGFDKALDPDVVRQMREGLKIEFGSYVRAGDRFENLVPPYAVVKKQLATPRYSLAHSGLTVTNDLRTVIIHTEPMKANVHYAVTLGRNAASQQDSKELTQHPQIDLDYSLTGVQAAWKSADQAAGDPQSWSGWLPHLDLQVARQLTQGSAEHATFSSRLSQAGELALQTRLDIASFLRPKIQVGATIDYPWPPETVSIQLKSNLAINASIDGKSLKSLASGDEFVATFSAAPDQTDWLNLVVQLTTRAGVEPRLSISASTNEDERWRPLPLNRFYLPWVDQKANVDDAAPTETKIAELEGGSWARGRHVFHSQAAACSKCHSVNGDGAGIGPDLGNLIHRDYGSVLRDIVNPSFAINPDHIGQTILLKNGQVVTGVLRSVKGQLLLGDEKGTSVELPRDEIESMKPAKLSIMPAGIDKTLGKEQLRDLLTYLLTPAPHMPLESKLTAPPMRTLAQVSAALAGAPQPMPATGPLEIVLVAGKKDHGPGEHDYPAWQIQWGQLLAAGDNVKVSTAWDFPDEDQLHGADVLVFFQKGAWNDEREKSMDRFFARGGGAVYLHWAVNGDERATGFAERIGLASRAGNIRYRHGPLSLVLHNNTHPILRNLSDLELYDESYWTLSGKPENITLLATSLEEEVAWPQVWTHEPGKGRVFVSIPGHYSWTFDDPLFRILLLRGIAWTAREPVDRFNELVPLGARMIR